MKNLKFTLSIIMSFSFFMIMAQNDDLIHYYKFDGTLDDEIADSNGVFVPGAGSTEPIYMDGFDDEPDGAILFPGKKDDFYMISLGRWSPSQEGTPNEMTVAFWAYWNGSTNSYQDIINKRDNWVDESMEWGINQHKSTGHILSVRKIGMNADSKDSIPTAEWTHVTVVMDNINAYFYKNGEYYDEQPYIFGVGYEAMINVGTSDNGDGPRANDLYNGAIDDLRFYSTALDEDEIMDIYNGIEEDNTAVKDIRTPFKLAQNHPNPFYQTTQISYTLTNSTRVEITVHNIHGQLLATLVNQQQMAGNHKVVWDASKESAGVYFYKMKVDNIVVTKKMIYTK